MIPKYLLVLKGLGTVWEWDGKTLFPSEATWDQLVDRLPTLELRCRYRGRVCMTCCEVIDRCQCGCCP